MNGEFQELLTEIKSWSKQVHEQRHQENLSKFDRVFDRLSKLPCERRAGFYTYVKWHLGILTVSLGFLINYVVQHIIK